MGVWIAAATATVLARPIGVLSIGLAIALTHAWILHHLVRERVWTLIRGVRSVVGALFAWALFGPLFLLASLAAVLPAVLSLAPKRRNALRRRGPAPSVRSMWINLAGPSVTDPDRTPIHSQGRGKTVWWFAAASAVACSLAVLIWGLTSVAPEAPELLNNPPNGTADAAAFKGVEWFAAANEEMAGATAGLVYTPFVGSSVRDFSGRYVNVTNHMRRSYTPIGIKNGSETDVLDVWFFGGSTMFGFDIQRDDHTVPSEFVRLAEADGIAVRARNYGSPGFVNYQEEMRLTLLLASGERPDVVIFYDGINDQSAQMLAVIEGLSRPGEPSEMASFQFRQLLADSGLIPDGTADLPSPLVPTGNVEVPSADSFVQAVHDVYLKGMNVSCALSDEFGFRVMHLWQPTIYTKTSLDPGERALLPEFGLDQGRLEVMARVAGEVADGLPSAVIDITDAFDRADGPVLADISHTNEQGARLVAEAIYKHARSRLNDSAPTGCD